MKYALKILIDMWKKKNIKLSMVSVIIQQYYNIEWLEQYFSKIAFEFQGKQGMYRF